MCLADQPTVRRPSDKTREVPVTSDEGRELRPVGRYDWEQIIRRARFGGLISATTSSKTGKKTKGAVSGAMFKAVALDIASYADDRGERIFPGNATIAVDLECSLEVVNLVKAEMVKLGLLQFVRGRRAARDGRPERGEEYRLTLPSDLQELVDVPTPTQHKAAAERLRELKRGRRGKLGVPRGTPEPADSGCPEVTPNAGAAAPFEVPPGGADESFEVPPGGDSGCPLDAGSYQDRTIGTTDHSRRDLRTDVAVVGGPQPPPDEPAESLPLPQRLPGGPALARLVLSGAIRPDELPEVPEDREAVILPFRRRRSA